jgi:peroxiredoxin
MITHKTGDTLVKKELDVGYTYVMLGNAGDVDRRMLLIRSMEPGKHSPLLPAVSDAGFFWVGKDLQVTPDDPSELGPRQRLLELQVPSAVFPSFALPEVPGESLFQDEVRVVYNARSLLPLRSSVVKDGTTVTVQRTLEEGKPATVELSGEVMTVKSFKEVYVIDTVQKAVTSSTREVHVVNDSTDFPVDLKTWSEVKATDVRFLEANEKEQVAAMDPKVGELLVGFGQELHPRDLYRNLVALEGDPGTKLVDGLYEALNFRLSSYRDKRARQARRKKQERKPVQGKLRSNGLIGNEAPDFALDNLDGEKVSFRHATKGKVVLLSFWARGCGPCRREAPYLSKLQEEFGKEGFTVMAVNGWNESANVVRRFVEENRLKQPILLMGSSVAQKQYSVPGYPASFWIDHEGTIVHREVGFRATHFPEMRERLTKMLAAAKQAAETP